MFLQIARPFMSITPEVVKPEKEVSFNTKLLYTFIALIIYFIMASTPLIGVEKTAADPFSFLRTITASTQGTLAELGIGPIVTAGLILQILVGSKIINVDMSDPEERALYTGTQKVLSVIMTIFEAVAYIIGGAYGRDLELGTQMLIIAQLVAAGILIILIDEMIQKGYGLGSGISLFIAAGVSTTIVAGLFSLDAATPDRYARGILPALFNAINEKGVIEGFSYMFFRDQFPQHSILSLLATIFIFLVIIYFESVKVEIPLSVAQARGMRHNYPLKLLYVSNIPVILVSAVFADLYFIAQILGNTMGPNSAIVQFIGTFEPDPNTGQQVPTGGLVYFLTAPRGFFGAGAVFDPQQPVDSILRAIVYAAIMIILSIAFSLMWVETAGMSSRDVAKQLIDSGMQIPGWRRNPKILERLLDNYIPPVAFFGGLFIGILAAGADFLGALGTGTGILLTVSITRQYFELLAKERVADMHPALRGFLGI